MHAAWTRTASMNWARRPPSSTPTGPTRERGQAVIELHELRKSFGAVRAVDGVSFVARDGETTALLGPNGAAKPTTLRMLYTLMRSVVVLPAPLGPRSP